MLAKLIEFLRTSFRAIRNYKLRLKFTLLRSFSDKEFRRFRCNICGKFSISPLCEIKGRESRSCYHCGSTLRFRSIVGVLSKELFGEVLAIPDFPESKSIVGIGMSDTDIYAVPLSRKLSYKNTYYHKEPKLNITLVSQKMQNVADFIISSDVFEHVPPPVDRAFENLYRILRGNGVCVFSVPYSKRGTTKEHFPGLFEYKIVKQKGKRVLMNRTKDGIVQLFEDLRFHGGSGATLEMRIFSESSLLKNIAEAGFINIKIHEDDKPEYGIILEKKESLIISMRKTE